MEKVWFALIFTLFVFSSEKFSKDKKNVPVVDTLEWKIVGLAKGYREWLRMLLTHLLYYYVQLFQYYPAFCSIRIRINQSIVCKWSDWFLYVRSRLLESIEKGTIAGNGFGKYCHYSFQSQSSLFCWAPTLQNCPPSVILFICPSSCLSHHSAKFRYWFFSFFWFFCIKLNESGEA